MNETFIPPELRETLVGPEEQLPQRLGHLPRWR